MRTASLIIVFIIAVTGAFYFYTLETPSDSSDTANQAQPVAIKAEVIDDTPAQFTIDVEFMENADANTDAEFFSVYISDEKPQNCEDFRDVDLSYTKPEEHQRRFDLSDHDDILEAIESTQCVIIPNTSNA